MLGPWLTDPYPRAYPNEMSRKTRVILGLLLLSLAGGVPLVKATLYVPPPPPPSPPTFEQAASQRVTHRLPINSGDTMDQILAQAGVDAFSRQDILNTFGKTYDVRKLRAGKDLSLTQFVHTGEVDSLEYTVDPDHKVVLTREESSMLAQLVEIPGVIRETSVCATLDGSLFLTMERAGESPELAIRMAQIFEFDIDFYRDPQPGDQFCLLVEKKIYENGQPPTYKRILAAKYDNAGAKYDAFLFGADGAYYSADGRSLKSAFLRSPLEFDARVSSSFSASRLHPVLHTRRAHLGTDYAAPTGTPVRSVAAGRVVFSGLSGGSGNLITIEHNDGYRSQYLHLSRRLVRAGQRVTQGDRIGLVGSTGLATGPHLDMRISRNGKYMDWERMRSPRTVTLGAAQKQAFLAERDRLVAAMERSGGVETAAVR